jgi:anti-sigma factor RsiW
MSLCESIDTLAMAYLDDELANEERRELETHLRDCTACRAEVDGARSDQQLIQTSLVAPRVTDTMRMRITRAIDEEAKVTAIATRKRAVSQLVLPGAAMLAAAAAIIVFVGVNVKSPDSAKLAPASVSHAALKQQVRTLPLEVQGPQTGSWVGQYAGFEPPHVQAGSKLLGARMLPGGINGHDGTLLSYDITTAGRRAVLSVLVIQDVRPEEMQDGEEVDAGNGRMVRVIQSDGHTAVTISDAGHHGFMFMADELPTSELIALVGRTSLVGPQ